MSTGEDETVSRIMRLKCIENIITSVFLRLWIMSQTVVMPTQTSGVTDIYVGVPIISQMGAPYDIERVGAGIEMGFNKVNNEILNSSYRLVKIERHYGPECSASTAPGIVADLYFRYNISALIGPACTYALDDIARLANYWNIPVITGLGDSGMFKSKVEFPTLTRLAYCQCRLRKVFNSVFHYFNWTSITLIHDVNNVHSAILKKTLVDGLQKLGIYPYLFGYYIKKDMVPILKAAAKNSRVILVITPGEIVREFMLTALRLGYVDSGEFVFMDVELFPFPGNYYGNHDWKRGDEFDADAKKAFTALLRVALHTPNDSKWADFKSDVELLAQDMYNFTYGTEEVNFFVGAFHDAVLLYGLVLNETLESGNDHTDGYALTRLMWNRTINGVTGEVFIDDNGDRDTSYSIMDLNQTTGKFQSVATFHGEVQKYEPIPGRDIHWAGLRATPPLNEPICGYMHEKLICKPAATLPTYILVLTIMLVIFIVVVVAMAIGIRWIQRERRLYKMKWKILPEELKCNSNTSAVFSRMSMVVDDATSGLSTERVQQQMFCNVFIYKGNPVIAKVLKKSKVNVTRTVMCDFVKLQEAQHHNLVKFYGACVDGASLSVITEYCGRGSLQDVLFNDDIKLDWTFRISLLKDITSGLAFLHNHDIRYHGNLKSSNCLVDARFVLKLTDFGLQSLCEKTTWEKQDHRKLMWLAPEILRSSNINTGSKEGDMYSLGIILEEVILRCGPFSAYTDIMDNSDILRRIISVEEPPFRPVLSDVDGCPVSLLELTGKCWAEDPSQRPSLSIVRKYMTRLLGGKEVNLMDTLLRRMEHYASNLEKIVQERTKQLAVEQRRSDELLYQILPKYVAEQLKKGNQVIPEAYESVTVYFSDIVGFTSLSSDSTPFEIVSFLNDLYTAFDSTIENYDVYKVETIGDAYMVVSGLPVRNGSRHAPEVCRLALALLGKIDMFRIRHRREHRLQMRIGVHSGPCVAGVVGLKMPRYCLFGDTVNTASRMETTSEAQRIHMSFHTKQLLDSYKEFQAEYRGPTYVKGKGHIDTYWLLRET